MVNPYQLRLLPLAVAAIVAATGIPIAVRGTPWWQIDLDVQDIVNNLLLYLPLGIALWRRSLLAVLASALLLSSAIEIAQLWSIGRFASPVDAVANMVGAMLGALAWRSAGIRHAVAGYVHGINGIHAAAAALCMATILVIWGLPTRGSHLSNWNPDFPMQFGNESTNDRPWSGEILQLILRPSMTPPSTAVPIDAAAIGIIEAGPLVLGGGNGVQVPAEKSRQFAHAAMNVNSFTLIARVTPANTTQDGPARIISFSADPMNGNFDLGQDGRRIAFRICTGVSEVQGERLRIETVPLLEAGADTFVAASYDGAVAQIHVNGELEGRRNLAAAACAVAAMCDPDVPLLWALLGGLATIIGLAIFPWRSRIQAIAVALLASAVVLLATRLLGAGTVPIATQPWTQLMVLFGASVVSLTARRTPSGRGGT
jgi:hypothetical protein